MSWRIVGLEHCVEDSFEKADFVGCMYGRQLGDRITGGVDDSVDARSCGLMIAAADLEVEGGDGIVGCGDVGIEVGLGDIPGESLSFLFQQSAQFSVRPSHWGFLQNYREL